MPASLQCGSFTLAGGCVGKARSRYWKKISVMPIGGQAARFQVLSISA